MGKTINFDSEFVIRSIGAIGMFTLSLALSIRRTVMEILSALPSMINH